MMEKACFAVLFVAGIAAMGSAQLNDGAYRIQCDTKNRQLQGMKANVDTSLSYFKVGLLPPADTASFIFQLQSLGDGNYKIIHRSTRGGDLVFSAYPRYGEVRLESYINNADYKWHLESVGNGQYRIRCDTVSSGPKYISAYPKSSTVGLDAKDLNEADQKWSFIRV